LLILQGKGRIKIAEVQKKISLIGGEKKKRPIPEKRPHYAPSDRGGARHFDREKKTIVNERKEKKKAEEEDSLLLVKSTCTRGGNRCRRKRGCEERTE